MSSEGLVEKLLQQIERLSRENEHLRLERNMWIEENDLLVERLQHHEGLHNQGTDGY